jgi:hypothetical protein
MAKDSFVFYKSFHTALSELPDDIRLKLYDMITSYALLGIELDSSGVEKAVFTLIKPLVDANHQKYENGCKGAEFGKLGGRPKKPQENPNRTPRKPQENPNRTPNENENENDNDIKPPFFISPLEGGDEKKSSADEFFEKYPRYAKDRDRFDASYDYQRLMEEFEKSTYLRSLYTAKQVIDIYPLIVTGEYRDKEKTTKPSFIDAADARAKRERWYAFRRAAAEDEAQKIKERFMQDEQYAKISKRLSTIEFDWAKAEVDGEVYKLAKLEQERSRLRMQRKGIIERNGLTEEDLEPKYHCKKCSDTGFQRNGKACDCYQEG